MLALFGNISGLEIGVIMLLAVLIFGSRLPEVAARVYTQFRRLRESIDRFRRDTGIDQEMREIQRNVRDAAWRQDIQMNLQAPEQPVMEREEIGMPPQNVPDRSATRKAQSASAAAESQEQPATAEPIEELGEDEGAGEAIQEPAGEQDVEAADPTKP